MAITWGQWTTPTPQWNWARRNGIDITYTQPTAASPTVTVTVDVWYQGGGQPAHTYPGGYPYSNTARIYAANDAILDNEGVSWTMMTGFEQVKVHTWTFTQAVSYDTTTTVTLKAQVLGFDRRVTKSVSIPRRPSQPPTAPSGVTASRVNDGRVDLSWSNQDPTGLGPYESVRVYRSTNLGPFVRIATLSKTAQSYSDTGTTADRHYRYTVAGWNPAGETASAEGNTAAWVDTTPATPGAPTASRTAGGIIVSLGQVGNVPPAAGWEVVHAEGGGSSSTVSGVIPMGTGSWTHTGPPNPNATHTYRVRVVSDYGPDSALSSSFVVPLMAPPNAPTLVPTGVADATEDITLLHVHNTTDTTPQRRRELRYRVVGAPSWTSVAAEDSASGTITVPGGTWSNGTSVERQVRTWGLHANPGPWSTSDVVTLSARPTLTWVTPDGTYGATRLSGEWAYHDPEGAPQEAWEVELVSGGQTVESASGSGAQTTVDLAARLDDGATYTVRGRLFDGQLWSLWESETFTVAYDAPPVPTLDTLWDPVAGTVTLTVDVAAAGAGQVPSEELAVYRLNGVRWTPVATGLDPGATVVDMTPPLGVAVYRAVAVSALPSMTTTPDVPVETDSCHVLLNYGPGFGQVVQVWANLSASRSVQRAKALHHFHGRSRPVEYAGDATARAYNLSADVRAPWHPPERDGLVTATWEEMDDLATAAAPVLVRDPEGTRLFCSVGEVAQGDVLTSGLRTYTVTLTEVDWAEALVDL